MKADLIYLFPFQSLTSLTLPSCSLPHFTFSLLFPLAFSLWPFPLVLCCTLLLHLFPLAFSLRPCILTFMLSPFPFCISLSLFFFSRFLSFFSRSLHLVCVSLSPLLYSLSTSFFSPLSHSSFSLKCFYFSLSFFI